MSQPSDTPPVLLYQTEDGSFRLDVPTDGDTVWLSLNQMALLFERNKSTISRHIGNIFEEQELEEVSVVANFATTAADGDGDLTLTTTASDALGSGTKDVTQLALVTGVAQASHTHATTIPTSVVNYIIKTQRK